MQRQALHTNPIPEGCERYDSAPGIEASNVMSIFAVPGSEPANPSGISYGIMDHCTFIRPNQEGCHAAKAKGTDLCIGHLKQTMKAQEELIKSEAKPEVQIEPEVKSEPEVEPEE